MTLKIKELRIIMLEGIIRYISDRYCLIDMLLYRSWVGGISLLSGFVKTSNIIHMWLSKFKKVHLIIWKLRLMRFRFYRKYRKNAIRNSGERVEMMLMLWGYWMRLFIKAIMVIISAWFSRFWGVIYWRLSKGITIQDCLWIFVSKYQGKYWRGLIFYIGFVELYILIWNQKMLWFAWMTNSLSKLYRLVNCSIINSSHKGLKWYKGLFILKAIQVNKILKPAKYNKN